MADRERFNLRPLLYWLLNAVRGMRDGLLIQLASISSMALALLLIGLAALGLLNLQQLTRHWGRGVHIVAYLRGDADLDRVQALAQMIQNRPEVRSVRWISPREAHARLAESLGAQKGLMNEVEEDFLPGSLEIRLSQEQLEGVRTLVALLSASSLIDEVDYMGDWARRLGSLVALLQLLGLGLAAIVALACLYIVGTTIRLGVYARREEIAILKLVGATDRFIRAPFMIEGTLQGLLGASLALLMLYGLFRLGSSRLESLLAAALSHVQLVFLSSSMVLLGLGLGALLGLVGSRLALGRYLDV